MMKLIPTIQGLTPAPQLQPSIPFAQPQANPGYQTALASSPFDDMKAKKPGMLGQPNIFGGQGPANIVPDAQGNVGAANPNGVTNSLFQTPGMDQISKMLMMGG